MIACDEWEKDFAYRLVKRVFKLAFGFAPRRPDIYFTYVDLPCLDFNIGGRSYSLIIDDTTTDYSFERNYNLTIYDIYGRGHDEYFCISEPYNSKI